LLEDPPECFRWDALACIHKAEAIDNGNPDVHYRASCILMRWHESDHNAERLRHAVISARRAIELDGTNVDYNIGSKFLI
ncbi:MAG: hypothetical protein AAB968_05005, partial [Patescibacteria group bacterium]